MMLAQTLPRRRLLGAFFLILAASIWGAACVVVKAVLPVIPPIPLVTIRLFIAAALFGGIAWWKGLKPARKDLPFLALIGLLGYPGVLALQSIGTDLTNASMAALVTSSPPVLIAFLAWLLLGEKLRWQHGAALLISFAGLFLIAGLPVFQGSLSGLGIAFLVSSAVSMAFYTVLSKRLNQGYSPVLVQTYGLLFGFLGILPFGLITWQPLPPLGPPVLVGVLYLSVLSTAVAFYLWNLGFTLLASGTGSLFYFFQPVVGVLVATLVGEQLTKSQWLGAVGILAGILLSMTVPD